MATAFISYTHSDEALKDQLLQHLAPLKREGLIKVWHDRMLKAGEHLNQAIQKELAASDIIILLVSAGFLNSEYCYEEEMQRAFARQRKGEAKVVAVILRPCQWKNVPVGEGQTLSNFLAVPKDGIAITKWDNVDEAFDDAAGSIRNLLKDERASAVKLPRREKTAEVQPAPRGAALPAAGRTVGGGRLLRPQVTDRDRSRYLKEALEVTATTFEAQLDALSDQDPRVETEFERVDSRSFVSTVYVDGNKAGECRIFVGAEFFVESLCLSFDTSARNSMNEWLSLETSNGDIRLKASAMAGYGTHAKALLSQQDAADYLWEVFLRYMQSRLR